MILGAFAVGYALGSLPTAETLGHMWGVDLRRQGSTNPGTNNALRVSGSRLAAVVLLVEAAKGYGAVLLGGVVADEVGMVAGGIGAVAGNVYNVWYRFGGGKGLGISLGVLLAAWPVVLAPVLVVLIAAALITRSSGMAAVAALTTFVLASLLWSGGEWATGGVQPTSQLVWLALGMAAVMTPKHWRDLKLKRAVLL